MPSPPEAGRLRRAMAFAAPHRSAIALISCATVLIAGVNAAEPLVLKFVFDGLAQWQEPARMLPFVALLVGLLLLRELLASASNWLSWRTRLRIHHRLLEETVGRLHRMPLRLQHGDGVGATVLRLDRSIQAFVGALTQLLFHVFPAVVYLVIAIVVMLRLDWRLALLVLAFAPVPALLAAAAAPEQRRREQAQLDQWGRIYSRFNEVLSGIVTVRSFAMEDVEKRRFLRDVAVANRGVGRGVVFDTAFGAASNVVVGTARFAALAVGGVFVLQGETTVGTLVAFLGYVVGLFGPVQGLSGVYGTLQRASAAIGEIFAILDVQEHLGDAPDATDLDEVRGEIAFEDVRFRYPGSDRAQLEGVTLAIAPGQTVAIVGPSGSGKSTLTALLMRFYDPDAGCVRIDGRDVRTIRQSSLRRSIGVVLQDPLLFQDTIRNNIRYGRPDAADADVERAARAACAHDFVTALPDGYETMAGERGARLSLGERQRVTIARALLKDPAIVVLDEATSALDAESEALVQEALEALLRGRTTLVIAHRLATVVSADRIVVLRSGRITESGSHAELVRLDGYYASLVRRQTKGLIPDDRAGT